MSVFSAIVVYLLVWWLTLFVVLPWGARPPDSPEPGHAAGAPERPMLMRKMLVTTLISAVIFAAIYGIIEADLISFQRMSDD